MKLRIKNTNAGQRGVWVNGELEFVDGGTTKLFDGASAAERDAAASISGLRVQSSTGDNGWEDHFTEHMPEPKPFLAIVTDGEGTNMKVIPLDGKWFIGTALANEEPENASGYQWVKVGGSVAEPVAVAPDAFDPVAIVDDTAPSVIAALSGKTPEQIAAIREAEESREGGARKGVMKAIDELTA